MEQFILFGDSITQFCTSQERGFAFQPALQDAYIRRLDVINRGYSGYNTDQALKVLPHVLPKPEQAKVRLMLIFFGANDARLPDTPGFAQDVPLERYEENLKKLIKHPLVEAHGAQVILCTAPPIEERTCFKCIDQSKDIQVMRRTAASAARYAEVGRKVGKELGVPVLDLWTAFMKAAGWEEGGPLLGSSEVEQSEVLVRLLVDGLHFTPEGYKVMFTELMAVIREQLPESSPDVLPWFLPFYDQGEKWQTFE